MQTVNVKWNIICELKNNQQLFCSKLIHILHQWDYDNALQLFILFDVALIWQHLAIRFSKAGGPGTKNQLVCNSR